MTEQNLTVEVDYERCQAHGVCAAVAPEVFGLREDTAQTEPLHDQVSGDLAVAAQTAVDTCPELAIRLVPVSATRSG
jgi:ferredoxin